MDYTLKFDERHAFANSPNLLDNVIWEIAYDEGYREPRYPVPATLINADAATTYWWICGHCPIEGGPCNVCIEEYMDALEYHSYWDVEH